MTTFTVDAGDIKAVAAECDETSLIVRFADGRSVTAPLDWFPRLKSGSTAARSNIQISPLGLHWPDLDEDLGILGLLAGRRSAN